MEQKEPELPQPPAPENTAAVKSPDSKALCDKEFDLYEPERQELRKAEFDSEKNLDTLLASAAGLFLGLSLTILKDFIGKDSAIGVPVLIIACVLFVCCLLLSLYDKRLTYNTHRRWRELLDAKFSNWKEGAWKSALSEYDSIPGISLIDKVKVCSWWSFIGGIGLLLTFVFINVLVKSNAPATTTAAGVSQDMRPELLTKATTPKAQAIVNITVGTGAAVMQSGQYTSSTRPSSSSQSTSQP